MYIPEVLIAARVMHAGISILRRKLAETGTKNIGKVVIGTVKRDLHDIGKNLVKIMIGAPITQNYVEEIGADGYSPDAALAVDTAKSFLRKYLIILILH